MREFLQLRRLFVIFLALGLIALCARNAADPDVWWHLRTGELVLQNHAVFHSDPYSFTRFGRPWINHEWLAGVLMFAVYRIAGAPGLILVFTLITALAFLVLFSRTPGKPYLAGFLSVWAACVSAPTFGSRPQIISLLLVSLFLWLLEQRGKKEWMIWLTIPLTALWVNLHGEFALGVGLIGLYLIGEALDASFESLAAERPRLQRLLFALVGCFAVVPLNPYGLRMYWYPWQTLSSHGISRYIQEWASPDFHQAMYLPFLLMVVSLVALAAVSPLRLKVRELLVVSLMLYAALRSARHIPIFALIAVPILAALSQSLFEKYSIKLRPAEAGIGSTKLILNCILLGAFAIFPVMRLRLLMQRESQIETQEFPVRAISFFQQNQLPGPLLNSYNWGGYLIWKLYPAQPVFVDGRTDLYDDGFLDEMADIYFLRDGWKPQFARWQTRSALLPRNAPLAAALLFEPGWTQIYDDGQAVILTESNAVKNNRK